MKQTKFKKVLLLGVAVLLGAFTNAQTLKWHSHYNSGGSNKDYSYAVAYDGSGNVYVTGITNDGTCNDRNIVTRKYNSSGTVQWTATQNAVGSGCCALESGYAIAVDANGYVWVACITYSGATYGWDFALLRYNNSGTLQANYPKFYNDADGCTTVDGASAPHAVSIYVYDPSNVYVGGSTKTSSTWNGLIAKDNVGAAGWSWTKLIAGSNTGLYHRIVDIKADASYIYATGHIGNTGQGKDIWVGKLDAATGSTTCGNCWTATYSNSSDGRDQFPTALVVSGSDVYVCGYQGSASNGNDAVLLKYTGGTLQSGYPATYNGSGNSNDAWMDIDISSDSRVIYVGGYANRTSTGNDYSVAAYLATTGALWTSWSTNPQFYDGAGTTELLGTDKGYALEYSSGSNRVYVSGMATENTPANNNVNITTVGWNATTGSQVWSASYDYANDNVVQKDDMAWKYGLKVKYNSTYCIDDIYVTGESYISTGPGFDYTTLKYSCGTCNPCLGPSPRMMNPTEEQEEFVAANLHPNPFSSSAEIGFAYEMEIGTVSLSVYDLTGRLLKTVKNANPNSISIQRGNLQSGVYLYKIKTNGKTVNNGKFIITD